MAERKYERYIVTTVKPGLGGTAWHGAMPEAGSGHGGKVVYMDAEVVPGGQYAEGVWIMPRDTDPENPRIIAAHTHDHDEILAYFGTDLDNPKDLGAEIEFWLGDEEYRLTQSCIIFIPAGLQHCPLRMRSISRPVFHFSTSPMQKYF